MKREAPFCSMDHQVFNADVSERATDHYLVITATRAVRVEVLDRNLVVL